LNLLDDFRSAEGISRLSGLEKEKNRAAALTASREACM